MQMVLDLDGGRGLLRSQSAGTGRRRRLLYWKDPPAESAQKPAQQEEKDEQVTLLVASPSRASQHLLLAGARRSHQQACALHAQSLSTPVDAVIEEFDTDWSARADPLQLEWPDFEPLPPGELTLHGEPQSGLLGLPPYHTPAAAADSAGRADHDDPPRSPLMAMSLPAADAADERAGERSQLPGLCGGLQSVFRRLRRGLA